MDEAAARLDARVDARLDARLDVWLWRARFFKTRSLAASVIEAGRIRVTHEGISTRVEKPARLVRPGDEVIFAFNGQVTAVRVINPGHRRGPPAEARSLYEEIT